MIKEDRCYVRVSTKYDSQKDSPEHQESFIKESAAREHITISHVYMDKDSATSIMERNDVREMIEDAQRGRIQSLWFASLSRFSRDALDAITLKRVLVNALKIRVVSIEDGYDSAKKDDELLFGIRSVVNQNTSGDIGVASRRGIRQSILDQGNVIASRPAFGYKKALNGKQKTYEIVPEQSAVVELIFNLYIDEGFGDKAIVKHLNGDNPSGVKYPSYTGNVWSLTTVQTILKNPMYTGYNVAGRYKSEIAYDDLTNLMNRRKKLVQQPVSEWEWSKQMTHPAIISKERYDLAQEIRKSKGARGGRRTYVNVFAKMIFCSECGSAMVSMCSGTKRRKYRYLLCSRRRRVGEAGCENGKWIPYQEARDELISEVLNRIASYFEKVEEKGPQEIAISTPNNNFDKEKRKLNKLIEDNRRLLFEVRRQHMLGDIDNDQYHFEKEQYDNEIAECQKRLERIEADEKRKMDTQRLIENSKKVFTELKDISSYSDNVERTQALLSQVVRGIYVDKHGEITLETYI